MFTVLTNKHAFFALLVCLVGTFNITFFTPYIATYFAEPPYFINEDQTGYILGVQSLVYLIVALIMPYTCEKAPRKFMFVVSFIGFAICCMLVGPVEKPIALPHEAWVVILAFPLFGFFQTFVFIPVIPEMLERL